MRRRKLPIACLLAAVYCSLAPAAAAEPQKNDGAQAEAPGVAKGPAAELTAAHKLYLGGNYAEAQEKYEAAVAEHPLEAALGLARCLASEGKLDEAKKSLEAGLAQANKDVRSADLAKLHAELARLAFDAGDYDAAEKRVKQVLAVDEKNRQARWIDAELHRTAGRLVEAEAGYKYFVDDYNATDEFTEPDDLRYIGLGAAQYARWSRLSDQFTFLVNDLYPSAVELDADYWPARYEAGMLFLEKYNEPEAQKEFKAALVLNPRAAEVYAALAKLAIINFDMDAAKRSIQRALDINPKLLAAHWASADLHLANYEAAEAALVLEAALKLNPRSEETLGRLAAAYAVIDGWSDAAEKSERFKKIIADVEARNPHAGEFYAALAGAFDSLRRFPAAADYYRRSIELLPQLTTARGELGLMYMRLGDEVAARKYLDESFDIDPFNVRVSNMRKVLDVLSEYAVIETEHFVIKFDRGKDEMLAKYAARYLEDEVFPELCKLYGFEPEGKSLFEIFNRSRNTGGHGWFSARMVGLPFVGTVGACAGKMVALASPNDMPEKFNWARVLKHEFVHVLNLQQSRFNIPHWYTEALAVESEGYPRSEIWNKLLVERVPKGELLNLDNINIGFVRPKSSLDWQMAYCQAQLYAQYMRKTYGDDALAKMLACYRDNLDTRGALKRSFDVDQADFEKGYLEYVRTIAKGLSAGTPADETKFSELVKAHRAKPDDLTTSGRLAAAYAEREEYPEARKLAQTVLDEDAKNQPAAYALAKVRLVVGEDDEAARVLEAAVDRKQPDAAALWLLATLKFQAKQYDEAEALFAVGVEKFPFEAKWKKALAKAYLVSGDDKKLATALEQLALADADDGVIRKKLARMALDAGDYQAARRWAVEALHCDIEDATAHRFAAEANAGLKDFAAAVAEYEAAVTLNDEDADAWAGLLAAGEAAQLPDVAKRARSKLEKLDPEHAALK